MLPRARSDAVVAGQRVGIRADVGRTLHVVVAAEDVRAAARHADVAERQLHDARCANERVAGGVLRLPHAPDECGRAVLRHHFGDLVDRRLRHAGHFLALVRRPLRHDVFLDLVHAVDAVVDVLVVLPVVLEDVVEHAEQERDVGARADAHEVIRLRRGAREARLGDDHLRAGFLRVQHVQHRHRVRLGGVAADVQRALRVLHVVVRIRHRAVAPGVRHPGDGRRVADARLVIAVVAAEVRDELAQQVRLLVAVLRAADPEHRVGARFLADLDQLVAELVDRLVPGDLLVLAVDELHRRLQPMVAVAVLADRCALRAVRAEIQRRIEHRLLAHPHAVLDDGVERAADRAVRAHGAMHLALDVGSLIGRLRLAHRAVRQLARERADAGDHARPLQEGAAVHRRDPGTDVPVKSRAGYAGGLGLAREQHDSSPAEDLNQSPLATANTRRAGPTASDARRCVISADVPGLLVSVRFGSVRLGPDVD